MDAWARPDATTEEYDELVAGFEAKYRQNQDFVLGVFDGSDVIGGTGFHLRVGNLESRYAEIGMWIHGQRAGQGLGTRLLTVLLDWGFTDWGFERLVWRCDPANVASSRVAEKCGLTYEGTLRKDIRLEDGTRLDSQVYAVLIEEWRRRGQRS